MEATSNTLPFHNKDLIPKDKLDRGLFVTMTVLIPMMTLWETWVLFHYHSTIDLIAAIHLASEVFVFINIIGNLYYLKRVDASGKQMSLPAVLKPGWRYCHFCELNSPPRSYHCPICNECILKRDRHCLFAGCCIGFHNHRYYFLSVIYVWIGATYSFFYQFQYFMDAIGGLHTLLIFKLLAPHIALLTGFLSLFSFIVIVIQVVLFLAIGLTTYLFCQQLCLIFRGQTEHEKTEGITKYNMGVCKNFELVLGKQWYLACFIPFCPSALDGDGLHFSIADALVNVKDL